MTITIPIDAVVVAAIVYVVAPLVKRLLGPTAAFLGALLEQRLAIWERKWRNRD